MSKELNAEKRQILEDGKRWFPYQANSGGIIYRAPCRYYGYDEMHTSNDTDDFYDPYSESLKEWGAIKEFSEEEIIAVALEADRRGYPLKRESLVMANIYHKDGKRNDETVRYFVIDGELIDIDKKVNDMVGKYVSQAPTDFEKRYLRFPPSMNYEKSGTVCRVCPFRPEILERNLPNASVVVKPERETPSKYKTSNFKYCTSRVGNEKRIHGPCKLPNQYGLYSGDF